MNDIPKTSGVYKITCTPTKKVYVGSAVNLRGRWNHHFGMLRKGQHANTYLQRAFNKYGEDAFTFEVIEFVLSPFLTAREQVWIDKLKACNPRKGFNMAPYAGSRYGMKTSKEVRAKLSAVHKGRSKSPEHRAKIGESNKGKVLSPETRAKISATRLARSAAQPKAPKPRKSRALPSAEKEQRRIERQSR